VKAARGFGKDVYFEMAATDIRALPKLEGTIHVNMVLIIKFMANYFFNPGNPRKLVKETMLPVMNFYLTRDSQKV